MRWAVIHYVHVRTPAQHIARLVVEDVPEDADEQAVRRALVRAGRQPSEFGIPWANHYVAPEPDWPDEVVGAYRSGEVPVISWDRLTAEEREERKITLRVSPELHAALLAAAERRGVSLQVLCVEALERAAQAGA